VSTAIVLFSGGMDSTTALYWALHQDYIVQAVTFNYPSRASQELDATRQIARVAQVQYLEVDLPFLQTAADLNKGNYAFKRYNVPEGYIPRRNIIFYVLGSYIAEIYGANTIIGGHVKTDSEGFPDATSNCFKALEQLINDSKLEDVPRIRLLLPFLHMTKTDVVNLAVQLEVPLELTWSCYYDQKQPCRNCESCQEREEAFQLADRPGLYYAERILKHNKSSARFADEYRP